MACGLESRGGAPADRANKGIGEEPREALARDEGYGTRKSFRALRFTVTQAVGERIGAEPPKALPRLQASAGKPGRSSRIQAPCFDRGREERHPADNLCPPGRRPGIAPLRHPRRTASLGIPGGRREPGPKPGRFRPLARLGPRKRPEISRLWIFLQKPGEISGLLRTETWEIWASCGAVWRRCCGSCAAGIFWRCSPQSGWREALGRAIMLRHDCLNVCLF